MSVGSPVNQVEVGRWGLRIGIKVTKINKAEHVTNAFKMDASQ